ncbi:hypothetical protein SETIT_9G329000v2 [Setaria italica]|uniref:Uncharacterized protein n=2 Tax=Setaria TaxID=4554 RepID=A0A368SN77_SETIT|nr:hypothetical protein SETIT_9G329000v2 [Setaria italica]TKV95025.1 hypothetical protein SEVIR_9G334900v2 [Setaria viridis]TKV95026.1 hypothetical protein SEVIR_9G334900v2 [Setaria viridis]TKV95027.1 hypothetical protein SEVIR_9G334900v2 [Setaria viridis]TKV95028.1 hypothetical protein SEVIR_9G334900v2 [Setaria viridis]
MGSSPFLRSVRGVREPPYFFSLKSFLWAPPHFSFVLALAGLLPAAQTGTASASRKGPSLCTLLRRLLPVFVAAESSVVFVGPPRLPRLLLPSSVPVTIRVAP